MEQLIKMVKDFEIDKKFYLEKFEKKKESEDNNTFKEYDLKKFTNKFIEKLLRERGYDEFSQSSNENIMEVIKNFIVSLLKIK